ncbi:MAG TPA: anhydro-N-acetylmuramic acid kinase, partial [Limnochordia bacterium]
DAPRRWRLIGLMSGTSADGIDAAAVEVVGRRWRLLAHVHQPYPDQLRSRLFLLFDPETARIDELCRLNTLLGEAFAAAALAAVRAAGLPRAAFDAVGSHGQTVQHLPPRPGQSGDPPATLQIGDPAIIAERTGIPTVADFRTRDMAVGGQGAPLVPWVDHWLFGRRGIGRIVQNIGGIGNATVLPPSGRAKEVRAFDTGPGNMVIDGVVQALTGGGQAADWDGRLARAGRAHAELLEGWLNHPFLLRPPPKSTGREEFGRPFIAQAIAQAQSLGLSVADTVATATELTVESIARSYEAFVPEWSQGAIAEVIVCGGGASNPQLMVRLAARLAPVPVRPIEAYGIPSQAKEALAFALLARQTLLGRSGNLPQATGARRAVVLGAVWPGRSQRGWGDQSSARASRSAP